MTTAPKVKICGLTSAIGLEACVTAGVDMVGFVFYRASPRDCPAPLAGELVRRLPPDRRAVGVFVDPSLDELERVLQEAPLDVLQLHGTESPDNVAEIKRLFQLPIIKAIKVASRIDLAAARDYETIVDYLLFDAKPPPRVAVLPGGNGLAFDWSLLADTIWHCPWFLSGGLRPDNVADALAALQPYAVDVSSGVEERPGVKSPAAISDFMRALRR